MGKLRYDYYTVSVPGDCEDNIARLAEQAINEARDRAKLYCVPSDWLATRIRGEVGDYEVVFRVRRRRNRAKKG